MKREIVKKGDFIVTTSQVCNFIGFIESGLFRMYSNSDGIENIVAFFKEETFISEYVSFLTRQKAVYEIQALENSVIYKLYYNDLNKLYKEYPEYERAGRLVAEDLYISLSKRNLSLLAITPEERYQHYISSSSLINRLPQYMIASYLGITPEALSRIRKRLSKEKK